MSALFDSKDWSEMLAEILDIIAKKHNLYHEDYMSFAGVCKSWRSAAVRAANKDHYPNGLPSRFPSLLSVRKKYRPDDYLELFCLSNNSIRKIRLPKAISGKLCMSSSGWLLTVGDDFVPKLIHPFSRKIINLPKFYTFSRSEFWYREGLGIRKLVLVDSSLVVMLLGAYEKLGFCRLGDEKWTTIIDSKIENHPTTIVTVSTLPDEFYDEWSGGNKNRAYILGFEANGLLVVIRKVLYSNIFDRIYKTRSFKVFKYDFDSEEWSEVKDLGTKALFVGHGPSFWMEEDTRGVIKGNCIYFNHDFCDYNGGSVNGAERDMGVYHMSSQTVEPHFNRRTRSHFPPPIWLPHV
ncbi:putative F-box protein At5g55150 [Rutidosis leptorrhynchoides]|uniref:putative F-box protein At5g55150 n=1 Tax=Rutidosis leptorrhynchoides TaxID=125765 RepID=UPI003A99A4BF